MNVISKLFISLNGLKRSHRKYETLFNGNDLKRGVVRCDNLYRTLGLCLFGRLDILQDGMCA